MAPRCSVILANSTVCRPEACDSMSDSTELMQRALKAGLAIPAFNIPYLPMLAPTIEALQDTACFGFIAVARLEWEKFAARSLRAVYEEYQRVKDERYTRIHLDHVPVNDEDGKQVEYQRIFAEALECGYQSIMIDGSRLPLEENITATQRIVTLAHQYGVAVEAELGAVLGHETTSLPPYEELFASGKGFTDLTEAVRFVAETQVDWLSIAVGNIHGAISAARREKKVAARLNIPHLTHIRQATGVPLVLHGGTGIRRDYLQAAIKNGIAKVNVATATRQPYEAIVDESLPRAQDAVYRAVVEIVTEELGIAGSAPVINPCG